MYAACALRVCCVCSSARWRVGLARPILMSCLRAAGPGNIARVPPQLPGPDCFTESPSSPCAFVWLWHQCRAAHPSVRSVYTKPGAIAIATGIDVVAFDIIMVATAAHANPSSPQPLALARIAAVSSMSPRACLSILQQGLFPFSRSQTARRFLRHDAGAAPFHAGAIVALQQQK